jgi:hypothetical protein
MLMITEQNMKIVRYSVSSFCRYFFQPKCSRIQQSQVNAFSRSKFIPSYFTPEDQHCTEDATCVAKLLPKQKKLSTAKNPLHYYNRSTNQMIHTFAPLLHKP